MREREIHIYIYICMYRWEREIHIHIYIYIIYIYLHTFKKIFHCCVVPEVEQTRQAEAAKVRQSCAEREALCSAKCAAIGSCTSQSIDVEFCIKNLQMEYIWFTFGHRDDLTHLRFQRTGMFLSIPCISTCCWTCKWQRHNYKKN